MTRAELDGLRDQLYMLEAAVEDVERDLAGSPTKRTCTTRWRGSSKRRRPLFRR